MKCTKHVRLLSLLLLLPWLAPSLYAEVSVSNASPSVNVIVLGITEGPDPIPQVLWAPVRDVSEDLILNADGAARGDGRPDIVPHPESGYPHVVWAYAVGNDHDIAYSFWTGTQWAAPEFLTSTPSDDAHPRLFIEDDGTVHVVSWEAGFKHVYHVERDPETGQWSPPTQVADPDEAASRPTVAVWNGQLFVAWESENAEGHLQIVVAVEDGTGGFIRQVVFETNRGEPLDVVLHVEQGRLWFDWRSSVEEFAYSELVDGEWTQPVAVPWADQTWLGEAQVRVLIRSSVLSD